MKKNFPNQTAAKFDFDDKIYAEGKMLEKIDDLSKEAVSGPNVRREPKKKKNEKARKKWKLLKNMLLAFRLKRDASSPVSLIFDLPWKY